MLFHHLFHLVFQMEFELFQTMLFQLFFGCQDVFPFQRLDQRVVLVVLS